MMNINLTEARIRTQLFEHFQKDILRGVCQGFAQWYQQKLADGWTTFEETRILNQKQNNEQTPKQEQAA